MNPLIRYSCFLFIAWFGLNLASVQAQARSYQYTDAHLHYVNFFQESEGIQALIKAMDKNNVSSAMLTGLGPIKKWDQKSPRKPKYYMADDGAVYWYSATDVIVARAVLSLPKSQQQRFHPFITGFNPSDLNAVNHVELMLELYPGLWQGIGEVITRHDDLTALTYGETATADHEALRAVFDLAAKHRMPVNIHSNLTSSRIHEPQYLSEMERALQRHPQTIFIWAHAGTSAAVNRGVILDDLDKLLARLLNQYPNLYIDLSWSVLDDYILDSKGRPKNEWLKLINAYPHRFVLGSDLVGNFSNIGKELRTFNTLLDALSSEVANQLAHTNFLRLLPAAQTPK
ncbi:amidohydrolase family protein [Alginatibacterium sediminis]|uniref:amidohydrolase family protein n=1 Tax=Alginatibacterium sediminis TaxID=2164068 RepID=UPI0018F2FD8C|nr:amidohydrolase family protein [Alginatibacterium sediminis]